jgi:hypothetical protein
MAARGGRALWRGQATVGSGLCRRCGGFRGCCQYLGPEIRHGGQIDACHNTGKQSRDEFHGTVRHSVSPATQRNTTLGALNLVRELGGNEPQFRSRWGIIEAYAPPHIRQSKPFERLVFFLLSGGGPASGAAVGSHERAGAAIGRRWIRHCDLAARVAPEVINPRCPLKRRAQGKPGARDTRSRAQKCTRRTAGAPEHPAFPAQWFYGLCRDLPGAEFLWPPSLTDWRLIESPVGPDKSPSA